MENFEINIDKSHIIAYSGIVTLTRKDLEKLKATKRKAKVNMVGLLLISKDVAPKLAEETIESIKVHGIFRASQEVKNAIRDRIL